jgi:hypothetical protein
LSFINGILPKQKKNYWKKEKIIFHRRNNAQYLNSRSRLM